MKDTKKKQLQIAKQKILFAGDGSVDGGMVKELLKNPTVLEALRNPQVVDILTKLGGAEKPPEAPPVSGREKILKEARESHSKMEVKQAFDWVKRVFAPMIGDGITTSSREVKFAVVTGSQKTRTSGLTSVDDDWREHRSIDIEVIALYYIDVIISEPMATDMEILYSVIRDSKRRKSEKGDLHPEFNFIIGPVPEGEELPVLEIWTHEFH